MTEAGPSKDEVVWLVKSGDRILGPFNSEDIKQRLYEKELVVIDEVTTPMKRWRYIRDEPVFAVVVEEIRKSNLGSREDTELGTVNENTQTSATHTDFTEEIDAATPPHGHPAESRSKSVPARAEKQSEKASSSKKQDAPVKQFGSAQDQKILKKANSYVGLIWLGTIVVLAAAAFAFFRLQTTVSPVRHGMDIARLLEEAELMTKFGRMREASGLYRQVYETRFSDPDFLMKYAIVALRSGDERAPTRFLDTIGVNNLNLSDPVQRARQESLRGLAALMEAYDGNGRQYAVARESFAQAAHASPNFLPARFNRAMTEFLDPSSKASIEEIVREFGDAEKLASNSTDPLDRGTVAASQVMIARTQLRVRNPKLAESTRDYLSSISKGTTQYWQEAALLKAYSAALAVRTEISASLESDFKSMLSADPFVTDEHYIDPMLFTQALGWKSLNPLCLEAVERAKMNVGPSHKVSAFALAAAEFCNFKKGDNVDQARRNMEDLVSKNPGEFHLRAVLAYFKFSLEEEKARAELNASGTNFEDTLGMILLGRLCAKEDYGCIARQFSNSTLAVPDPAYLILGAARNDYAANDSRSGDLKLSRLREKSPHYIPLLMFESQRDGK